MSGVKGSGGRPDPKPQCSALLRSKWGKYACNNPGKVEFAGKWYCGTHDPERRAAAKAKRQAAVLAELERVEALDAPYEAICEALEVQGITAYIKRPLYGSSREPTGITIVGGAADIARLLGLSGAP